MAYYISSASNLRQWITTAGYTFVGDEDRDGTVESGEETLLIDTALSYASDLIDGYICSQINPTVARASGNSWLTHRCVDIAVWRMAGQGGRDIPVSIQLAYENTIKLLEGVRDGNQIPGYNYSSPSNTAIRSRAPVIVNPGDGVLGSVPRVGGRY